MSTQALLEVKDLKKHFSIVKGLLRRTVGHVKAVDGINLTIRRGETLGLVGESGCGKSTLGRTILRLTEATSGQVWMDGVDVMALSKDQMRMQRMKMQIIFQDPFASLNPRMTVGDIVGEPLQIFGLAQGEALSRRIARLLEVVGIEQAAMGRYPHQFSGGQRQRIGIARALALDPELIICDEPVSALDVSVRSQVLNLMADLQAEMGLTYLLISHDLSVVKHISDRVAVMYLGRIVELADKTALYDNPLHPYTRALMSAIPIPDPKSKREKIILSGDVPSPANPPAGCRFHPRCPHAMERCAAQQPALAPATGEHFVACFLHTDQSIKTEEPVQ